MTEQVTQEQQAPSEVPTEQPETTPLQNLEQAAAKALLGTPEPEEAQESKEEAKAEETPQEPKKDGPLSAEWEKITRKDAELTKLKRELAAQKQNLTNLDDLKAKAKEDPRSVLESLGIDAWQVILDAEASEEKPASDETPTVENPVVQQKIADLEKQLKEIQDAKKQEHIQSARQQGLSDSSKFLKDHGETYQLTATHPRGNELLLDTLIAKYQQDKSYYDDVKGAPPTYEEVAADVEAYLEKQAEQDLQWISKSAKTKSLLQRLTGTPLVPPASAKPSSRTLTNDMTTERPETGLSPQSEQERIQLAIKQLQTANS